MKLKPIYSVPDPEVLEKTIEQYRHKRRYGIVLRSTVYALVVVAALAVLVATLWTPVLQIYGSSMAPTLEEGQFVVSLKGAGFHQGDLVSFYIGNKLLVKRVIAVPGDWVNISEDGTVYVNETALDEPYIDKKAFGQCDLDLPYQVPESSYFLMGDHRETSVDSRYSAVGAVAEDQIVGKIVYCVWPLSDIGVVN
jgi:signal peptidase I